MEVCAPCGKATSESAKAYPALLSADDLKENPQTDILNCLVSNLEDSITKHLHIEDAQISESMSKGDATNNANKGGCLFSIYEKLEACPVKFSSESSGKCTNSPCNNVMSHPLSSHVKELKAEIPLKLVSAMKGSREKQGLSLEKLTVTWAPDVYDPPPTSVSHLVTRGKSKQRMHNKRNNSKKKNGKNKQKGNTSRGGSSGGKDKKQSRKVGGAAYDRFVDSSDCYGDLESGSPDYCGNGFLMQSLTKVHYSTAEAL